MIEFKINLRKCIIELMRKSKFNLLILYINMFLPINLARI